jgi:hypothetical protein
MRRARVLSWNLIRVLVTLEEVHLNVSNDNYRRVVRDFSTLAAFRLAACSSITFRRTKRGRAITVLVSATITLPLHPGPGVSPDGSG